jgi:hypothetical protein
MYYPTAWYHFFTMRMPMTKPNYLLTDGTQSSVMPTVAQEAPVAETTALIRTNLEVGYPKRSATERWGGKGSLFSEGFLSVPNKFLRRYASLNPPLTPGEALFVLQLMTFKWERAAPFPTYKRVAQAMGVTDKMARRYAQGLQRKGYLVRQFQDRAANKFDLTGLFDALTSERG